MRRFRAWFKQFDAAAWHEQFAQDSLSGKLDRFGEEALRDSNAARRTELRSTAPTRGSGSATILNRTNC
jgi:hypothetical protein